MTQNRIEINRKLIEILQELVEKYPELRFNQLMDSFGFTKENKDDFYTESSDLLNRVETIKNTLSK